MTNEEARVEMVAEAANAKAAEVAWVKAWAVRTQNRIADAFLSAIEKENARAVVAALPGWQPIETAPKAGAAILVFDPRYGRCVGANHYGRQLQYEVEPWPHDIWHMVYERDGDYLYPTNAMDNSIFDDFIELHPTHWMPLPAEPRGS